MSEQVEPTSLDALRAKAERLLDDGVRPRPDGPEGVRRSLHELQVHQVELQLQNEELQHVRQALLESERQYRDLFHRAPVPYVELSLDGRIQRANLRAAALLGSGVGELVGRALASFMAPHEADELHLHLTAAGQALGSHVSRVALQSSARGRIPVRLRTAVAHDARGASLGYRTVIEDLVRPSEARDQLRASEARSAAILHTLTDAVVTTDALGHIEMVNRATETMFGWSEHELLGRPFRDLARAEDGPIDPSPGTWRTAVGCRRDGSTFPLRVDASAWSDGEERKLTLCMRDRTEAVRQLAALASSEERFRQIAEHVSDAFWIYERATGRVSYASPASEAVWGHAVDPLGLRGEAWLAWVQEDDRPRVEDAFRNLSEAPFAETFRVVRADGGIGWIHARAFPVPRPDGQVARDIVVAQDHTRQRQLQQALDHAQRIEAVGAVASGIAHDFGNLLQGVLGCITVARSPNAEPERVENLLDAAARAAREGAQLASRMTRFSRQDTPRPVPMELDGLLADLVPLVERLLTERNVVRLDAAAPGALILADPVHMQQLLLNLAANSRDAMPEGGLLRIRTGTVETTEASPNCTGIMEAGQWVWMTVSDNGVGMPTGVKEQVFEPFFTTKEAGAGTGLGLSTVFTATKELGGHVHVDSEPDAGTSFTFHFPWLGGQWSTVRPPPTESTFEGTVLLVEDNELVRITVRHYLEEVGFAVLEASHPGEALTELQKVPEIELLISDVNLPMMSGIELARVLRQRARALPVLFMSASPTVPALAEIPEAKVLQKPFGKQELLERISALLASPP